MSKYNKLWVLINNNGQDNQILSFDEIEKTLGFPIDHSFLTYKKELFEFGYEVKKISMKEKTIVFTKKSKKGIVVYIHGKGGNASESEHYQPLFPNFNCVGLKYSSDTPWDAMNEFPIEFKKITKEYSNIILIANSIGAYYCLSAINDKRIKKTFLISPMVDMRKTIVNMMNQYNISEKKLFEKQEIITKNGDILSWKYWDFVNSHKLSSSQNTFILYGQNDCMTDLNSIKTFVKEQNAHLTIMPNGEHWFHTKEQMQFIDKWITDNNNI